MSDSMGMKLKFKPAPVASTLAAALAIALASSAVAQEKYSIAPIAPATLFQAGEKVAGPLPASTPVRVVVSLKLREREALDAYVASLGQGAAKRAMSRDEVIERHAPTKDDAKRVADFLSRAGFTNVDVAPNRLLVSADGTAAVAAAAFRTTLARVQGADGAEAYANVDPVQVPAELADVVLAVLGLQTVHHVHSNAIRADSDAKAAFTGGHSPGELGTIYGASTLPAAADVTVGVIAQGSMVNVISDLNKFTGASGYPPVTVATVAVGTPTDTASDHEWDLDSQAIVGMAGGRVKKLVFYTMPTFSNADLTANYNNVLHDTVNSAKVINISLGDCELNLSRDGSAAAQDQIFQMGLAQGQTFVASSGDYGSNGNCNGVANAPANTPEWPASSQYVVAVGGTRLITNDGAWFNETVWNDVNPHYATGGGFSTFEPQPSWQAGVGQNIGHTTRGVPDVAYDAAPATGANIYVHGVLQTWGGTSLSAPLFTGAWARILEQKGALTGSTAQRMYQLPVADFHDIVTGNCDGFAAAGGWDACTGFGSMIVGNAAQHIAAAGGTPSANFTYAASALTVSFTDTSTDPGGFLGTHSWTFGDGGTSFAVNPVHAYAAAGTYTVTETVVDSTNGKSSAKSATLTLSNAAPYLRATPSIVQIPAGQTSGSYSLSWSAPGYSMVTLYGKQNLVDPGKIKCLGSGTSSGTAGEGIKAGEQDDLYLLSYTGCTAGTIVTTLPGPTLASATIIAPTMAATPNPVPIPTGANGATFTLSWNMPGQTQVTLYGEQNLDHPGQYQCLGSGPATGTSVQYMSRGEIAHLAFGKYSTCTPGTFFNSVPLKLAEITVTTR